MTSVSDIRAHAVVRETVQGVAPVVQLPPLSSPSTSKAQPSEAFTRTNILVLAATEREVRAIARSIAQASIEALAGTRPVHQLSRSLSPGCFTSLQHRAALTRIHAGSQKNQPSRLHRNPSVRSVRVCAITSDICEATLVVAEDLRSRAVAMRLERQNGLWRVTALEIG